MNEATLKQGLVKALEAAMPGAVVLRHEDRFLSGVPDISASFSERTAWLEAKRAVSRTKSGEPRVEAYEARQTLMLKRLDFHAGIGLYVIYEARATSTTTWLVPPCDLNVVNWRTIGFGERFEGYNHAAIAARVKEMLCR